MLRSLILLACASSLLGLSSCSSSGSADVVNPTAAELDRLDVQWGLEARKPKGGPRRVYQYADTGSAPSAAAPAPSATVPPARETVNAPPPPSIAPQPAAAPAPSVPVPVPSNLR